MTRLFSRAISVVLVLSIGDKARGDDATDAVTILDRAIQALGGEEKLIKAQIVQWKGKVKWKILSGFKNQEMGVECITQGLTHSRRIFEGELGGNPFRGTIVLAGEHGWHNFERNVMKLDSDGIAYEKRTLYLNVVPMTIVPLKGNSFKAVAIDDVQISGKPAAGVKVTGPDGKDFTLYFDKGNRLPVKQIADVPFHFGGDEFTQETQFNDYRDLGGIQIATKLEITRLGVPYQDVQVTDFKILDKVGHDTFAEPKSDDIRVAEPKPIGAPVAERKPGQEPTKVNLSSNNRSDDVKTAAEILDRAIKALGGEEKLSKAKVIQWKEEGTSPDIPGQELHFTVHYTTQGLDHARIVHEFRIGGLRNSRVVVLAGERGWRNFDDNQPLFPWGAPARVWKSFKSSESRINHRIIPITVLPLKGPGFKVVAIADAEVSGKPAAGVKVTGPDGKDFTLYFDKESGLPAKQVFDHLEITFSDYKEVSGIKKAMHVETKGRGVLFQEAQIIDFKILDKVDPQMFAEPQ